MNIKFLERLLDKDDERSFWFRLFNIIPVDDHGHPEEYRKNGDNN